ncbi:MAG: single-stranded DNA-binding protein [Acidobacteria bacterium]|nr:single-stranded DNA-binding protein [Acidobacteriota bacterium]MBI3656321.1 single-stranded DNA-binding protein [Acidobacteriota bacterium]
MAESQIQITDNLDLLLFILPPHIREALQRQNQFEALVEIVLDLGRQPEGRFHDRGIYLSEDNVTREDIKYVVSRVGLFTKDNRAGIERTLHRISAIRNRQGEIIGLTCRVGRAVFGTVDIIRDVIESGQSILLLGRPGVGKTTLLRESARVSADEMNKRVIVVDTSNEIAGDGDIPHPGIGRARRMQVPAPELQHAVMIEAVENHMPEVIVIDEIGTEAEALAARTIAERGVQLIATAHGNSLDNLLMNPTLSDLVGGVQAVTLSDEEARKRRTQKTVLERRAPPTFEVLIEIQEKIKLAVHHDVAEVVDRMLRNKTVRAEIRTRNEDGTVQLTETETTQESSRPEPYVPLDGVGKKEVLRILPFAVSRTRLERAIKDLQCPAYIVENLKEADTVLTLKSQEKRQPKTLREGVSRGLTIYTIKSNTTAQIKNFLREYFGAGTHMDVEEVALREVEDAIKTVLEKAQPVELSPQNSYIRKLQHQLVQRYGLMSESKGEEAFRHVVIYMS